jgi:hypothetical protein
VLRALYGILIIRVALKTFITNNSQLLMLILFLGCYTMWLWIIMPTFQRYMLPPFGVEVLILKMEAARTSETSASSHTSTRYNNLRTKLASITSHHESHTSITLSYKYSDFRDT